MIDFVKSKLLILETKRDLASYARLYGLSSQILKGITQKIYFPRTGFWCKDREYAENCKTWKAN